MMVRYTIDIDDEFSKTLEELAKKKGGKKSDVLRDAVSAYKYLKDQEVPGQKKVSITDASDKVLKDVVLP
jgi:predicted transcriptional regulator